MSFVDLFPPEAIRCGLRANDRDECFAGILDILVKTKRLGRRDSEKALEALRSREKLGSTGIGGGVAIPHVKLEGFRGVAAAIATYGEGIEFDAVDGEPVRVVFLVIRPSADDEAHLQFLRWVSKIGRNPDFRRFARDVASPEEMLALLREMSGE